MRIVAGEFGGRPLVTPRSRAIRPTTDRNRESIFNVIGHAYPEALDGSRVLDLFAGTGALGLEAISRGASHGLFVEESVEGRGVLRENIEALGLQGRAKIFRRDATRMGAVGTIQPFDLVFADPPYGKGLAELSLASALSGGWLVPGALLVVEEASATPFEPPAGLTLLDRRSWGDTVVTFARA